MMTPKEDVIEDSINKEKKSHSHTNEKSSEKEQEKVAQQKQQQESASPIVEELQNQIATLKKEAQEASDQLLRRTAELDNFRKRLIRDKEDSIKYANQQILSDLIQIIDNFERAIVSGKEAKDFESFVDGVEMIHSQILSTLDTKYGLKQMESLHQEFDPALHEAIAMVENQEHKEKQIVLEEYQKGYMLSDRVLRPAKVVVSKLDS